MNSFRDGSFIHFLNLMLDLIFIYCFHYCFSGLYLVKMMSEYVDMNAYLPTLSAEVVHRVAELLKLFNSRTAHLVLGANALQVLILLSALLQLTFYLTIKVCIGYYHRFYLKTIIIYFYSFFCNWKLC